jgi:hypothetical protein
VWTVHSSQINHLFEDEEEKGEDGEQQDDQKDAPGRKPIRPDAIRKAFFSCLDAELKGVHTPSLDIPSLPQIDFVELARSCALQALETMGK